MAACASRSYDLRASKKELRVKFTAVRRAISKSRRAALDEAIRNNLFASDVYRRAKTLLIYDAVNLEIVTRPIVERALSDGIAVAYPRCERENHTMTFHFAKPSELSPGAYGICEPPGDAPAFDPSASCGDQTLCIVPALVYDRDGYRLGYGGGYYDRFLPHFRGVTAGMIYDELLTARLPRGKFDRAVSLIITESGIRDAVKEET